ncbi:hypothetical protein [Sulfurirhabdus autotrophica]|nr:hypothetical protein [Sulfurirhabdus autotrophica]
MPHNYVVGVLRDGHLMADEASLKRFLTLPKASVSLGIRLQDT